MKQIVHLINARPLYNIALVAAIAGDPPVRQHKCQWTRKHKELANVEFQLAVLRIVTGKSRVQ